MRCAEKHSLPRPRGLSSLMRFINLTLFGYLTLILGAGVALSEIGALRHVPPVWIGIVALAAVGVGIMISAPAGRPAVSEEIKG